MALNFVANFKMDVRSIANQREVNLSLVVSDDVLCTRPLVGTVLHQSAKNLNVLRCDCFWNGETTSHGDRNSELVKCEVWVWSDDSSCREVDSFAHEVSSESPLFSFKPCSDTFNLFA